LTKNPFKALFDHSGRALRSTALLALHRLEEAGWLTAKWDASDNNRRAKYYTLTKTGRRQLTEETADWNRIALAIARALEA
jgi:DNA-binding PadR family transcriptional regulator